MRMFQSTVLVRAKATEGDGLAVNGICGWTGPALCHWDQCHNLEVLDFRESDKADIADREMPWQVEIRNTDPEYWQPPGS